jgi:hypothetical protein
VSKAQKIGVLLMLVVLLVGPLFQIYDCFNDSPVLDNDAILHSIDALFCLISVLVLAGLFALVFALVVAIEVLQDESPGQPPSGLTPFMVSAFDPPSLHPIRI